VRSARFGAPRGTKDPRLDTGSLSLPSERALGARDRFVTETLCVLYMAAVSATGIASGIPYLFFPELAALSHDVLTRPWGRWAGQPWRLIVTPTLTGLVGMLATRLFPYHVLTILGVVVASLAIIALLRSTIAPAISAGVLPLVLGTKSWLYPPSVAAVLVALAVISVTWRRWDATPETVEVEAPPDVDDARESRLHGRSWLVALLAFVAVVGSLAQWTGLRFLLFPPLVVIAYEMFGHPDSCPWAGRPLTLPIACLLTAGGGTVALHLLGPGPGAVAASLVWGVAALRAFDVHMPPALAVALIPFVMEAPPTLAYPASVGAGTLLLSLSFLAYRRAVPVAA